MEAAGFSVSNQTQKASDTVPSGTVIGTTPAAGSSAASGSGVTLVVSSGPAQVTVPSLLGKTQQQAQDALNKAGLTPDPQGNDDQPTNYAPGTVSRQSQPQGTKVAPNSSVQFWVAPQPQNTNGGQSSQPPSQGATGNTGNTGNNGGNNGGNGGNGQ
ncbi:PASTA domain-containing protein [Streptacidiphilus sp. PAMC 29251]